MPAWRRIEDLESFLKLREKAALEGALAYINELSTALNEKVKTLDDLKEKINRDAERISGALSFYLWEELKSAGIHTGLFDEAEKK